MSEILIAGPCAAESASQITESARILKENNVQIMRASLFKPRTKPGFEGVGKQGVPWLQSATQSGLLVATEVIVPDHVSDIRKAIADAEAAKWILWIGSRNQNSEIQRQIARRMLSEGFSNFLMVKNQPWESEDHWLGIVEHITSTGFPEDKIVLCHRGFVNPHDPRGFRNPPNFEMAMRVKEKSGSPMIFDPSHVGGTKDKVFEATKEALRWNFDGWILEIHPTPSKALSDKNQQLDSNDFKKWLGLVNAQNAE